MSANNLLYRPEDETDPRPFVEIIVARLGGQLRAYEKHYGRFYCIADWVHHVTGSNASNRYEAWEILKSQMDRQRALEDSRVYLYDGEFQSSKGSLIKLDATDEEGLYYIFQFIYQDEPNDTIKAVRKYLAMAGVAFDLMRREPDTAIDFAINRYEALGKTPQWIQQRINGQVARQKFMDALTYALVEISKNKWEYGKATNTVYFELWGRATEVLQDQLDIKRKIGNLRDNLPAIALSYLSIAEGLCADRLGNEEQILYSQADSIIRQVSSIIGKQIHQIQEFTGKDMITGWELISGEEADYYESKMEELGQRRVGKDGKFLQ